MPPTTFGVVFVVQSSRPGSIRSGEKARKKSLPTSRPLSASGSAGPPRASSRGRSSIRARRGALCAAACAARAPRSGRWRGPARGSPRAASGGRHDRIGVADGVVVGGRGERARLDELASDSDGTSSTWLSPRLMASTSSASMSTRTTGMPASAKHLCERQSDVARADNGDVQASLGGNRTEQRQRSNRPHGRRRKGAGARAGRARSRDGGDDRARDRRPTRRFQPVSTVSTHSVVGRSVTQGTPYQ